MASSTIPRELIPWFPTIDYELCAGDRECYNFCKNGVFEWDEDNNRPIVRNPYQCVVGCQACLNVCPVEAITFPSKDELRATLKRLREELATPAPVAAGERGEAPDARIA
jgi:NAD-dependent dihydropyrimidine dehydrogenase PreA subunit